MTTVSNTKWRDAVKFLMNLGVNPTLTAREQRSLREHMRGPFMSGMTEEQAASVLANMGWQKSGSWKGEHCGAQS